MKRISIALVLASLLVLGAVAAYGGSAYDASFTTSVTYQNLGDATANVEFMFYDANSQITTESLAIASGAGSSLYVGNVSDVGAGFEGSGVVVADQPIAATMVQISSDPDVKNRPLSNGFTEGASEILLATVLKNQFNATSRFSIQNAQGTDGSNINIKVELYDADNPTAAPLTIDRNGVSAGSARYFDMGDLAVLSGRTSFNGSAIVTAVDSSSGSPANIVGTVMELSTSSGSASSFEAVTGGSTTVYMPSAICEKFGQNTFYAIQNTSSSDSTTVTISYSDGSSDSKSISPGAKASVAGCNAMPSGTSGSATITSATPIVVIGKVVGNGASTAFLGESSGSSTLALPYVRWTTDQWDSGTRQRAYIAIQNVGSSALSAGDVTATYIDRQGNVVATHALGAIPVGGKLNTNAGDSALSLASGQSVTEFGYEGGFGGSILIEGPTGSELVAISRITSKSGSGAVAEDYNGISVD